MSINDMEFPPRISQIDHMHEVVKPHVSNTPVLRSPALDRLAGAELLFKAECLQPIVGSFKIRGAANAILCASSRSRPDVLTQSSGNHAQAVALMAQRLGGRATIVMPNNANPFKKDRVKKLGAEIIECEPGDAARKEAVQRLQKERDFSWKYIHPFDNWLVIAGQATAAKEMIEDNRNLDAIVAPVGGGGLISGTSLAVRYYSHKAITVGAEPFGADDAYRSLKEGSIQPNESIKTCADGLVTTLGEKPFDIIRNNVDRIVRVTEKQIIEAMRILWEEFRMTVEPSGAVPFAAVLKDRERFAKKQVGIILTGGNVDLNNVPFLK